MARDGDMFSNTKNTLQNSAYIVGGKGLAFLASFVVVTVMGRFVPRDVAGEYNYIIAALSIISILTLPGMNNALTRAIAKGQDGSVWPMMKKRLLWGSVGVVVCVITGVISSLQGNPEIGKAFFIAAPFVPLTDTFSNFAISFWQGKKRFDRSAIMLVSYYFGLAILSIPVFILSKNLLTIITFIMLAQTAMGLLVYMSIKKNSQTYDPTSSTLGIHLTIMQAFGIFATNIDKVIVWYLFGPVMVAIYTFAANPVSKAYQMIPIGTVTLPHLSNHTFTEQTKKDILKKTFWLFAITIPGTFLIIISAPFLYKIFFPKYPESVIYFQIMMASIALSPVLLLKSALTAFNKTKALYVNEIGTPIIKVILMLVLAILFGLYGMVIGIFISSFFDFGITLAMFLRAKTIN